VCLLKSKRGICDTSEAARQIDVYAWQSSKHLFKHTAQRTRAEHALSRVLPSSTEISPKTICGCDVVAHVYHGLRHSWILAATMAASLAAPSLHRIACRRWAATRFLLSTHLQAVSRPNNTILYSSDSHVAARDGRRQNINCSLNSPFQTRSNVLR
jgi:hypothetical protein